MSNWYDYFMGFARHAASKSKDTTKVGCVIVGPDKSIRMTGYNGLPPGVTDAPERLVRPEKYRWTDHAERAALLRCARNGVAVEGCSIYVTHAPCGECMKSIIQAGITCVYVGDGVTVMDIEPESAIMADEAGVRVVRVTTA